MVQIELLAYVLVIKVFMNSVVKSSWYQVSADMQKPDIGIRVKI